MRRESLALPQAPALEDLEARILLSSTVSAVGDDLYEDNNTASQVSACPEGGVNSPNLGPIAGIRTIAGLTMGTDGEDWFRFRTAAAGGSSDYVRVVFEPADGDLRLALLDESEAVVRGSQVDADGRIACLTGLPAGTYYARVFATGGQTNPSYQMSLQTGAPAARLLSAPYTTDEDYHLQYELAGLPASADVHLAMGPNVVAVAVPSGGPDPFELLFDVTRVGSMADQTHVEYDLMDRPSRVTDALGRPTRLEYDGLARLTGVRGPGPDDFAQYSYDGNGNLLAMEDPTGLTQYSYDNLDQLSQIVLQGGQSVQYGYDLSGRVTSVLYPDGTAVLYGYDQAGRLASVTQGSDVTRYAYYTDGLPKTVTLPNGIGATFAYDAYGRLIGLEYRKTAGGLVTAFHYTLDHVGNRTAVEIRRANSSTADANDFFASSYSFQYDAVDRLVHAAYPDGSVVDYQYDANGNRLSMRTDADGAGPLVTEVRDYHYGQDNRLESITDAGGATVSRFSYDPRGNVVLAVEPGKTTRYDYNYRNLLVRASDGTTVTEYEYDGNGERVARIVNGRRTAYVNDPTQAYTQVLLELDGTGAVQARYTYGLGRIAATLPGQAGPAYYLTDALGSASDLTGAGGAILQSCSYDAFGALRSLDSGGVAGASANEFLFTGERVDPSTGLVYLRARYYDPATGRFLTKDPAGFVDGTNLYVYARNTPTLLFDPDGHRAFWDDLAAIVVGAVGGLVKQGISDFLNRQSSGWYSYVGAAVGGATYSWVLAHSYNATLAGAAGGLAENTVTQWLDPKPGINPWSALGSTLYGGAMGWLSGAIQNALPRSSGMGNQTLLEGHVGDYSYRLHVDSPHHYFENLGLDSHLQLNVGETGIRNSGGDAIFRLSSTLLGSLGIWEAGLAVTSPGVAYGDIGGVLLNRAADFFGDLSQIIGATIDPVTGQVVLLGMGDSGGSVPELRLDDFVAAVRAVFGSAEDPGVTIDPQPGFENNPGAAQMVHLFAGLEDTDLGWVLFEADRVMKTLAAEKDNVSGQPVASAVPGYKSMLQRWADSGKTYGRSRFWFVPSEVKLVRSDEGNSFVFDTTAVKLLTEDMLVGNGAMDPDAEDFAAWFTKNYDQIAQEEYTVYDYQTEGIGDVVASKERIFARLAQAAKAIAFARFLYDNQILIDFSWIENYPIPRRNTPQYARTVQNSRGSGDTTIVMTGGVSMETPNVYLPDDGDAASLGDAALDGRPDPTAQQWTVTTADGPRTAVALSLSSGPIEGLDRQAAIDLAYRTAGDQTLQLGRYCLSSRPVAGDLGYGWECGPFGIAFTRPEFNSSPRSSYTLLNGLREGEVRITDRSSGQVLTFVSSLQTQRPGGQFLYSGLNAQGVPDYAPGGSEQPDGSTLVQMPGTLSFLLTRPGGQQSEFDCEGRLLWTSDARGRKIRYEYAGGLLAGIRDDAGRDIRLVRDSQSRIVQAVGLCGDVVNYGYDPAGDLVSVTRRRQGASQTTSYEYDNDHHVTAVISPDGVQGDDVLVDIVGRSTARTDVRGNQLHRYYDQSTGTSTTTDDLTGAASILQTDAFGRPTLVCDALGRQTRYTYQGNLRQPSVIELPDPGRPPIRLSYDAQGRLTQIEDPVRGGDADGDGKDDHPIQFEYDSRGNLLRMLDACGRTTQWTYNEFSQPVSMTRAAGTSRAAAWTWRYDPVTGFLASQTDPSGVTTEYAYDAFGNVTRQTVAPHTPAAMTTTYQYDDFGRLIVQTDGSGRQQLLAYNGWDQVTSKTLVGPTNLISTATYDDQAGRRLAQTDANGYVTQYAYDSATGDLVRLTDASGSVVSLSYDRFGQAATIADPLGNVTAVNRDSLGRQTGTVSLGATPRVTGLAGSDTGVQVDFSAAMNAAVVDNGADVVVTNQLGQPVSGAISFERGNTRLTWTAALAPLAVGQYTLTLKAQQAGQWTSAAGDLLDGEFFGLLPSGDNSPGGDFVSSWIVDDHGNDASHATALTPPCQLDGQMDSAADADWFSVVLSAGCAYRITLTPDGPLSAELCLFDADGQALLAERLGAAGPVQIDLWRPARDGTYFLAARSHAAGTGNYRLAIDAAADDCGDSPASAKAVDIPSMTAARVSYPGDVDVFSFDATAGRLYRLATVLDGLTDSYVRLLSSDGQTVIAENDNASPGDPASLLRWLAPADGTFFVEVRAPAGRTFSGGYELSLCEDDHGDLPASATAALPGQAVSGRVDAEDDRDWFRFVGAAGHWYRVQANPISLRAGRLGLYDAAGASLIDSKSGALPLTLFVSGPGSAVYAKMEGQLGCPGGTYTLEVSELTDDYADSAAGAQLVTVPSATPGQIERPCDVDWFRFHATGGTNYRLQTTLLGLPDTLLRLYDASGTFLLEENDDYRGPRSRLDWEAPADGDYCVQVSAWRPAMTGAYTLDLSRAEDTPPQGGLTFPVVGSVLKEDVGYVDVTWTDNGSGIHPGTVDAGDLAITGVTVTSATARAGGVWRYAYSGSLPRGKIEVRLAAGAVADCAGNVSATRTQSFTFSPPGVDLVGSFGTLSIPASIVSGSTTAYTVPVLISNVGDRPVPAGCKIDVQILVRPVRGGSDRLLATPSVTVGNLRPGQSRAASVRVKFPVDLPAGEYAIVLRADSGNSVAESIEANNETTAQPHVTAGGASVDLWVSWQDVKLKSNLLEGDTATATVLIGNRGNIPAAGKVDVEVFARAATGANAGADIPIGRLADRAIGLPAGKTAACRMSLRFPFDVVFGNYTLFVRITPRKGLPDADLTNNTAASRLQYPQANVTGLDTLRNYNLMGTSWTYDTATSGTGGETSDELTIRIENRPPASGKGFRVIGSSGGEDITVMDWVTDKTGSYLASAVTHVGSMEVKTTPSRLRVTPSQFKFIPGTLFRVTAPVGGSISATVAPYTLAGKISGKGTTQVELLGRETALLQSGVEYPGAFVYSFSYLVTATFTCTVTDESGATARCSGTVTSRQVQKCWAVPDVGAVKMETEVASTVTVLKPTEEAGSASLWAKSIVDLKSWVLPS